MEQQPKRYSYSVRHYEGNSSTFRTLICPQMTDVIDKSFTLYKETWKRWPDMVVIKRQGQYTYK